MKIYQSILVTLAICIVVVVGCKSTPQTIAYNTLYSVEKATTAAYDGYVDLVIKGKTTTLYVPTVSKAYDHFQASFLIALDAVQFNTNSLSPASLTVESQDLINLIHTVTK